jgi:hypothetical protein
MNDRSGDVSAEPKSLVDRAVGLCLRVLVGAVALDWAWTLIRPIAPLLVFGALIVAFLRWQRR